MVDVCVKLGLTAPCTVNLGKIPHIISAIKEAANNIAGVKLFT